MKLNIDEIIQNYSYSGKLDAYFPIERFSCNVSLRVEQFVDDIDEVVCGILHSKDGEIDFNSMGDILGFSVYDKPEEKKYKDQAEVDVLHQLLKDREAFYLLRIENGANPQIALTDSGLESIDTKKKYQYYNALFSGYFVNKFKGIAYTEILSSFEILPEIRDLRKVQIDKVNSICFLDKDLHYIIQNLCNSLDEGLNSKLLSFKEPNSYNNFDQPINYKLYVDTAKGDEIILAYNKEKLLYNISTSINEAENHNEKAVLVRDIKFERIWKNPNTIYDSALLLLFLDKWNWIELLDRDVKWSDEKVWEIFNEFANVSVWNKISLLAPVEEITNQIHKWIDRWNWTTLSERLPDDIILSNIDNPLLHWDFDVLSLKETVFVQAAMTKIQSYNDQNKEQKVQSLWNFYEVTETLDDNFIIEALSANAAINFQKLSQKPYSFVSQIFKLQGAGYSNWDYDFFSQNWTIDEILNEAKVIGQYINWHSVLLRITVNEQTITQYLKSGRLNELLIKYVNSIKSFTTENILWDAWLINYLDSYSLILWQTTRSQKGFDTNEYFDWNELLLQKYIAKFTSTAGKAFFSTKVQTVAFIRKNISFDFDWVAIFDSLENNETLRKELSGNVLFEFREILPWKELSSKIKSDKFILNNVLRFKEYFDFEILSGRNSGLVESLLKIPDLSEQNWNWSTLTQTVSDIFILDNFNVYSWDYLILSSKESNFIEKAILSNDDYNLHWDWDKLANSLSSDFILQILPFLNTKFGSSQPIEIQQFWHRITRRLDRTVLKNTANKYLFQWDWSYITKELFTKDEILNNLDSDAGYWDWQYLLANEITTEDLEDNPVYLDIQLATSSINDELKRKETIILLTKKLLHKPELLIYWMTAEKNNTYGFIKMDWDVLSNHKQFIYSDTFIAEYVHYWNWDLLSANKIIFRLQDENGKLSADLVASAKSRLKNNQFRWNWSVLSRNNGLIKNPEILSDKNIVRKWDWAYISEFAEFINVNKKFKDVRYLYNKLQNFIDWQLFSKRKDIHFEKDLLTAFSDKSWNWQFLSESYNLEIDNEFLIQLQAYPWNWMALSKNKNIRFTLPKKPEEAEINPGILISLKDKEWDWNYLSERKDLEVSYQLIDETKDKNWNYKKLTVHFLRDNLLLENYLRLLSDKDLDWSLLSSSPKPKFTYDFINEFKNFWDWKELSSNKSIALTRELVTQFDKWDFRLLTKRPEIIENPQWIFEQKNMQWDWDYISSNEVFMINEDFIGMFNDKLNFTLLSSNPYAKLTPLVLKKYYKKWNYNLLENNYSISRSSELTASLDEILSEHASIKFMQKIDSENSKWKGYIYHFTHLTNAVNVINSRKILSRNKALQTGFSNSAGTVVENRHDAHDFARFYFRPQTPTQFYNENLGMDSNSGYLKQWSFYNGSNWVYNSVWKSHYPQAQRLGLPRCPIPVFFRFKLNEVLEKMETICKISNGNMQTGWAKFGTINSMIDKFNFDNLFSTIGNTKSGEWHDYIEYSQQEFLVKDEFDFSNLETVEIIVPDESSKCALLNLIGFNDFLSKKILVDDFDFSIFHRDNRKVNVTYESDILNIKTDYRDKHFLSIEFIDSIQAKDIDGDIISVSSNIIKGTSNLSAFISDHVSFLVRFTDELNRDWVVFQNNPLGNVHQPQLNRQPATSKENNLSENMSTT